MEDDLRAEVERLTKTVEQCYLVQKRLTEQRDNALAEVERIRKEVHRLQAEQIRYWGNKCNSEEFMTEETDHKRHSLELGKIAMWLEDFAKSDSDSTYLCFLRLLADYRHLQAQALDNAVEREEERNDKRPD